jgi:hypothetical protein
VNEAAEFKLRAERKAGEMLREMPKHPPGPAKQDPSHDDRDPPKLEDIGISYSQSSRWQAVASVEERTFEAYIRTVKPSDGELTTAGLLRDEER